MSVTGSLSVITSGSAASPTVMSVDGNNGRLFEVTDDLSNSLFSVNTIAGLPAIEAFSDYTVNLGQYGQNILTVSGSMVYASSGLTIGTTSSQSNFPFYVTGPTTTARYTLTSPGMGFNLADGYAQLQMYGTAGAYIDFTAAASDYQGRIMWSGGAFSITGNMSWGGGTLSSAVWNGTAVAVGYGGTGASTASGARTNLGLVIGTDVLAYRTFGTAANNNTGDFATAAQGTTADNALPKSGGTMTGNISMGSNNITFTNTTSGDIRDASGTAWFRPRDGSNNLHIRTSSGGIYLDTDGTHYFRNVAGTTRGYMDSSNGGGRFMDTTTYSYAANMNQNVRTTDAPTFAGATLTSTFNLPGNALISVNSEPDTWGARFRTTTSTNNLGSSLKNIIWCGGGVAEGFVVSGVGTGTASFEITNAGNAWIKNNLVVGGVITENSSIRYKKDIDTIKYGIEKVLQMRGVTYINKDTGAKEMGVIAEEVQEVLPEVVLYNKEGQVDSVSYGRLSAVFIEAIKELKQEINEQNLIISELKRKLGE